MLTNWWYLLTPRGWLNAFLGIHAKISHRVIYVCVFISYWLERFSMKFISSHWESKKCNDKQESGTCHHLLAVQNNRETKKARNVNWKLRIRIRVDELLFVSSVCQCRTVCIWHMCVCVRQRHRHLLIVCYDGTNIIGSHHISCECKVFHILIVANSDSTMRQHAMLACDFDKNTHIQTTHTRR